MLTPIEIKGTTLKSGMGYAKKQVDDFLDELFENYEQLYKENIELKDKLNTLSEGIQYYKTIEKTLQKALVLAEKTAAETKEAATIKGQAIEREARGKAATLLTDVKNELNRIQMQNINLAQQYDTYKAKFKQILLSQLDILESDSFQINFGNLNIFSDLQNDSQEKNDVPVVQVHDNKADTKPIKEIVPSMPSVSNILDNLHIFEEKEKELEKQKPEKENKVHTKITPLEKEEDSFEFIDNE